MHWVGLSIKSFESKEENPNHCCSCGPTRVIVGCPPAPLPFSVCEGLMGLPTRALSHSMLAWNLSLGWVFTGDAELVTAALEPTTFLRLVHFSEKEEPSCLLCLDLNTGSSVMLNGTYLQTWVVRKWASREVLMLGKTTFSSEGRASPWSWSYVDASWLLQAPLTRQKSVLPSAPAGWGIGTISDPPQDKLSSLSPDLGLSVIAICFQICSFSENTSLPPGIPNSPSPKSWACSCVFQQDNPADAELQMQGTCWPSSFWDDQPLWLWADISNLMWAHCRFSFSWRWWSADVSFLHL